MTPWEQKREIDTALEMVARNGFVIDIPPHGWHGKLGLFAVNNAHGFATNVVLEAFDTWREVLVFMAGWEKRELAQRMKDAK